MTPDEPRRPNPDALLAATARPGRGRLKVFLGMAPGVGKTFEMLRAARRRKVEGVDVVVGVVETHGRRETQALLRGLEILPRAPLAYRERTLLEFDLDGALARRPSLILVDEYAHDNVPGSRHAKRWQDVEELLAAGLDVWTTLNVQHLESLKEVVWKITGVRPRESVPDSALSGADEIELVDITPSELRTRMAEGKVYMAETAHLAAERFFKLENLTALRELALRRAAQKVDDQLIGEMKRAGVEGPWAAGERILVLLGADAAAGSLVRAGRRLSDMMMDAPWVVAHVERPSAPAPSPAGSTSLNTALKLAEQLGGSAQVLTGEDLVQTVLGYARGNNITQIVVGKVRRPARPFRRSLVAALLEEAQGAALHVITDPPDPDPAPKPPSGLQRLKAWPWIDHIWSAGIVTAAGGLSSLIDRFNTTANLAMIFMVAVLLSGLAFGLGPAITAAALSALVYNFFFLEPRFSFAIGHATDVLTFVVFFAAALTTGWLTGRNRDQTRMVTRRAAAFASLLSASRRLSSAADAATAAQALAEQLSAGTGGAAVVLMPKDDDIELAAASPPLDRLGSVDQAAASWTWRKGEPAGAGTGTLPNATLTFRPLAGVKVRAGVAGVEPGAILREEDARFVNALMDQGAVALERADLAGQAADAEALRRSDRLRSALLNSVSHDLRTPLSTVLGSVTTLIDYGKSLDRKVQRDLLLSIREEAERLNRYVGDLLDMSRLEGGALVTRKEWVDLRDVASAAADRVSRRLETRTLHRDFPAELTMVRADPSLLEQVLVNILENAISYSPDSSAIEVAAYEDRANVVISIEDEGRGIPTAQLERVFEKFRRMEEASDRSNGAGLGLAIAKGFIEAMGGRIAAASPIHDGRGTRVLISLPKDRVTPGVLF